jgi:hypothetical protein
MWGASTQTIALDFALVLWFTARMLDLIIGLVVMIIVDRVAHRDMAQVVWGLEAQMSELRAEYRDHAHQQDLLFEDRLSALALENKELRDLLQSAELREANVHAQLEILDYRLSDWNGPDSDD